MHRDTVEVDIFSGRWIKLARPPLVPAVNLVAKEQVFVDHALADRPIPMIEEQLQSAEIFVLTEFIRAVQLEKGIPLTLNQGFF